MKTYNATNAIVALSVVAFLAGCAAPAQQVASVEESRAANLKPIVDVQGNAPQFAAALRAGVPVTVDFASSPKLSEVVAKQLAAAGAKSGAAPVAVKAQAGYSFVRTREQRTVVDLGKAIEASNVAVQLEDRRRLAERSGGSIEMAPTIGMAQGTVLPSVALGGTIIDSVLTLSGARASINRTLVGDSRGLCLGTSEQCADWKRYSQEVRVRVDLAAGDRTESVTGIAFLKDEKLHPELLFEVALAAAIDRITGSTRP